MLLNKLNLSFVNDNKIFWNTEPSLTKEKNTSRITLSEGNEVISDNKQIRSNCKQIRTSP